MSDNSIFPAWEVGQDGQPSVELGRSARCPNATAGSSPGFRGSNARAVVLLVIVLLPVKLIRQELCSGVASSARRGNVELGGKRRLISSHVASSFRLRISPRHERTPGWTGAITRTHSVAPTDRGCLFSQPGEQARRALASSLTCDKPIGSLVQTIVSL